MFDRNNLWSLLVLDFFITLNISCYSLQDCRVSAEKSDKKSQLYGNSFVCNLLLFHGGFHILCLSLTFSILIMMFLRCGPLCIDPVWDSLHFLGLNVSFSRLEKLSTILSSHIFSAPFTLFTFWDSYKSNVCMHDAVSIISYTVFIYFPTFSFFCLASVISTTLSTSLLIYCSLSTSAFFISVVFFISL